MIKKFSSFYTRSEFNDEMVKNLLDAARVATDADAFEIWVGHSGKHECLVTHKLWLAAGAPEALNMNGGPFTFKNSVYYEVAGQTLKAVSDRDSWPPTSTKFKELVDRLRQLVAEQCVLTVVAL